MIAASAVLALSQLNLKTRDATLQLNEEGWITSLKSRATGKEYSPIHHSSPLLSLHEDGKPETELLSPISATSPSNGELELKFPNGSVARVRLQSKDHYFRFQLLSLINRGKVDDIVWGPIHTNASKKIGDLIGVVRDDNWAIGMLGLDDNTISGPPTPGDAYGMEYYVHSPDPKTSPVPPELKEGQIFNIGGDGVSDTAFYSHAEEYFQMAFGTGARLEPDFGSSLAYHSRDRRHPRTFIYSLLPHFPGSRPRHQITDSVNVDFIGSAVALYACPDGSGLDVIEDVQKSEHLSHVKMDGKWVRDPSGFKTDIAWYGPHDKLIEYADALGLHAVQDEEQGEYYANPVDHWTGPRVGFSSGVKQTYRDYTHELAKHGIKYGLHTLCLFAQAGRNSDVTPAASPMLQTVLRTKLAEDIAAQGADITVTDPSFLAEDGTWPMRDGSNTVRIGTELLKYSGISSQPPYTLKGVQRGQYGTTAQAHQAGTELDKLQMNCYGGFVPDMNGMLDYADYYAKVMVENGMEYIDFDGLESTLYQNQGYFGVRCFLRRFVETFGKLTHGKAPRIMGSCVFAGGWEYMSVCNVGGGSNMFDPVQNKWGIEGKDVRNGLGNSYFPPTFGVQDYQSNWSVYDAENLQAKAIGWDATYMLGLNQSSVEQSGEKTEIFKAFRAWEDARSAGLFTSQVKQQLRDLNCKFHLQNHAIVPIHELHLNSNTLSNPYREQSLQFALKLSGPASGLTIDLPGGGQIACDHPVEADQYIICKENRAYLATKFRKKLLELALTGNAHAPSGQSNLTVTFRDKTAAKYDLTVWLADQRIPLSSTR